MEAQIEAAEKRVVRAEEAYCQAQLRLDKGPDDYDLNYDLADADEEYQAACNALGLLVNQEEPA